jgi:hypothetical protein
MHVDQLWLHCYCLKAMIKLKQDVYDTLKNNNSELLLPHMTQEIYTMWTVVLFGYKVCQYSRYDFNQQQPHIQAGNVWLRGNNSRTSFRSTILHNWILKKVILKHLTAIYQPTVCVKVCSPIIVYSSDCELPSTDASDSEISEQSDTKTVTVLDYLQMLHTLVCIQ